MTDVSEFFNFSHVLQDIKETDPIILAAVGVVLLGVGAWSVSILVSRLSRGERRKGRGRRRRSVAAPPRVSQEALAPLVAAIKDADRRTLGDDLARLIERHRNKRFLAFVVVTRTNVNPFTFAFLYQAFRAQSRSMQEVHEFQVSVRDANEILRACLNRQPQA
jgi:hypothetical protein